jgi:hypothetical protein
MTAKAMYAGKRGMWRSGHCSPANPEPIHRQCSGVATSPKKGTLHCACHCHHKPPPAEPDSPSEHTRPTVSGAGVGEAPPAGGTDIEPDDHAQCPACRQLVPVTAETFERSDTDPTAPPWHVTWLDCGHRIEELA